VKVDTHVHTVYSGPSTIRPLTRLVRECYNSPEGVYRRAKARGMDLVAITDHDSIDGALTLAGRSDVLIGCEVTGAFPEDGVRVHLGVLGLNEAQHRDIQRLRFDVRELLQYLNREELFVSLNHVASRINGHVTAAHIAALMPWVNGIEVRNGSRLPVQNRTAMALAEACRKVRVAGSDSHTSRGIGRTYIDAPHATTKEEFLTELHAGRVKVHGRQGNWLTMSSDIIRVASSFYRESVVGVAERPLSWRSHAVLATGLASLPLMTIPLVVAAGHFMLEQRFNRALLLDLVARPASAGRLSGALLQ
jgi:predicted metal-dependent phosphoesterase TrpH